MDMCKPDDHYHSVFDAVQDGLVVCTSTGRILDVNPAVCRMFGYSRDEMLGMDGSLLVHPDARDSVQPYLARVASGERVTENAVHITKDGRELYTEVLGAPFEYEGAPCLVVSIRDVSMRRETEERLRWQSQLLANVQDSLTATDLEGRVLYWSKGAERLYGYTAEEVLGRDIAAIIVPGSEEEERARMRHVLAHGFWRGQYEQQARNGRRFWADTHISLVRDEHGEPAGQVGIDRDITELRQAEEALRFQAELLDHISDAIIVVDFDGVISFWNRGAERMFGYSTEEALWQPLSMLFFEEDREELNAWLIETVVKDGKHDAELRMRRKDQAERYIHLALSLRRDGSGEPIGIITYGIDVTERRLLESQLHSAQKMEAIGRLAGGVAHDFNNLLSAILGYAEFVGMTLPEDSPAQGDLEQVQKAAHRASELTRQLLAFARKQVIEPRVVDLNEFVRSTDRMLRRLIGEDVELVTLLKPNLNPVRIDPAQFEQVLMNLAVNARDAMPAGGKLTIETENVTLGDEYVRTHVAVEPGEYVRLAVSDTGSGMDRTTLEHIFEPFFTTKEPGEGTGLGLATVHGIVKQAGGHIWVYSEPGGGAAFKIYFPALSGHDLITEEVQVETAPKGGNETILVAEDETLVRRMVVKSLEQQGYNVLEADTGSAALARAQEFSGPIDLVVTDVVMPIMGGKQLADELARLRPGTPFLFVSGYTENAIVHHGVLDAGIAFLPKPFTPAELLRKVRQILDNKGRG